MFRLFNPFYAGVPLDEVAAPTADHRRFCERTKNQLMCDTIDGLTAVIRNLRGQTESAAVFDLPDCSEADMVAGWTQRQSGMAFNKFAALKAQALYLHGRHEDALREARVSEDNAGFALGHHSLAENTFYFALASVKVAAAAAGADREALIRGARERHAKLVNWTEHCQANFAHQSALIDAELRRLGEDHQGVIQLYERAIQAAQEQGFTQDEALARELYGDFLATTAPASAALHYRSAMRLYGDWGAPFKVKALSDIVSRLVPKAQVSSAAGHRTWFQPAENENSLPPNENATWTASDTMSHTIDSHALISASQAISGEVEMQVLAARLLRVCLSGAGGDFAALVLQTPQGLRVAGRVSVESRECDLAQLPLEQAGNVPSGVVQYVTRGATAVLIDDVSQDTRFQADSVLKQVGAKSVLCVPLLRAGQVTGALYLHHTSVPRAFPEARAQLLGVLAAQAAISIENANLVGQLREKNEHLSAALHEARENARIKAQLLANTSHELKTPLNAIINFPAGLRERFAPCHLLECESCHTGFALPDAHAGFDTCPVCHAKGCLGEREYSLYDGSSAHARKYLGFIESNGKHLLRVVQDLLDMSTLDAGRMKIAPEFLSAREVVQDVVATMDASAQPRRIALELRGTEDAPVLADPVRLRQVLMNLVENAIKFSPDDSRVELSLESDGPYVTFCVRDWGVGIEPSDQERIFEEFFQVDSGTTKRAGGTGLGLAISRRMAELHHGSITVESQAGKGSAFRVRLPSPVTLQAAQA